MFDSLLFIYIITSILLIIIPGPNVLVIISTSLSHGVRRGLQTVIGTSSAMAIQLLLVSLGTGWFVSTVANGFYYLKWFGVSYLLYLGVSQLMKLRQTNESQSPSASGSFLRGFVVSLSNPKTLLFFSAFLPQFIRPDGDYTQQMVVLSAVFLCLATVLDGLYAIVSAKLARLVKDVPDSRIINGFSGGLYLLAGVILAGVKRA